MNEKVQMIGNTYQRFTVLADATPYKRPSKAVRMVSAQCSCGTIKDVEAQKLRTGKLKSCGCIAKEISDNKLPEHLKPLYASWYNMIKRAKKRTLEGDTCYVAECWDSWEGFKDWSLRQGWVRGMELCRNNDTGDYSPDNSRWDTKDANRKEAHAKEWRITYPCGKVKNAISLNQFCKDNALKLDIMYELANGRKKPYNGWQVERVGNAARKY